MPERVMQTDDPAQLAARVGQLDENVALRQLAGALAGLAGRVDRMDEAVRAGLRPRVTTADRREALERARDFIAELGTRPATEAERIASEVLVARYLTGE